MIDLIHVDQGEILLTFSLTMPFEEVLEIVSNRLEIPTSIIIIYNSEGYIIDCLTAPRLSDNSQLFLFRRDSVNKFSSVFKSPWQHFKDFPGIDFYELPFCFENYEKFSHGHDKIPKIEKKLYEYYCSSKEIYAKYMVKLDYLEKGKSMIEIRLNASFVLLKNLKQYYKKIKLYWKEIFQRSTAILREYDCADYLLNASSESILNRIENPEIKSLIKEAKLKKFAFEASRKLKICCQKVHDIKSRVLRRIKNDLTGAKKSTERLQSSIDFYMRTNLNFNIRNKEKAFASILSACHTYSECRENIEKIFDRNNPNRKEPIQAILSMEKNILFFKDLSAQLSKILTDTESIENVMAECIGRVGELYKEKIINLTSLAAQKLKYKVKYKLKKLEHTLKSFKDYENFLHLPMNISNAHTHAQELEIKHSVNAENIFAIYSKISGIIINDHQIREEFLANFGEILPECAYSELISPVLKDFQIKKVLNISEDSETSDFQIKTTEKQCILNFYEKEVKHISNFISEEEEKCKINEKKLYDDIKSVTQDIIEMEKQIENNENTIKNFSQELALLKGRGGKERLQKNFLEEVQKLKEKEAVFKSIFMEQVKELSEANMRLKCELIENFNN